MWSRAHSVVVPGRPEEVFAYLADFSRHAEWSPTPLRIEPEDEGPLRVGSRFRGIGQTRGKDVASTVEVIEVEPPGRLSFVATSPSTTFRHEITVTAEGEGSRVERRMVLLKAKPVLKLIWPLVAGRVIWPSAVAALEHLREVLASRAPEG
ncbi:MAG: SRPBCC family protein [Actinobacteria bacterium]|nr:SRPBCC family protein [Actinomycetota bacterium]